jgi:uncharacterized protein YlxW (UPF0749 family)
MLLGGATVVAGYLAWRYRCSRGIATDDERWAAIGHGERTMSTGVVGLEGERVIRWMADSPAVFESVRRMLQEYDEAVRAARAAQADREQLQQHCDALREEVRYLQAEVKRLRTERAEAAQWFAAMMREGAARFPVTPPPA